VLGVVEDSGSLQEVLMPWEGYRWSKVQSIREAALSVMALTGLVAALLLPLGMRTTGRALERIAP
jgi:hypothetical protein